MSKQFRPESSAEFDAILQGTVIGDAAVEVSRNKQFPIQTSHLVALCVASQACSAAYCVSQGANGDRLPIGLYVLGEQPPGSAKTGTIESLQAGIMEGTAEINEKRKKALREIEKSIKDKKGDIEEYEEEQFIANQPIKAPMTDVTPESIDKTLTNSSGWFMLASTEQALINTLIGGAYSDGNSNKDLLLKGFNGEWHASERVTRSGFFGKPHGSLLALSQEGTIDAVLKSSNGSGLVERFLMILEGNMFGHRDPKEYSGSKIKLTKFKNVTKDIFMRINDLEGRSIDDLRKLNIDGKASEVVIQQMIDIEPLLADGEKYSTSLFRGIWSKMSTQIYKIAATIHLTEGFDERKPISKEHIEMATCIVKMILRGMISLCEEKGVSGKSVELAAAEDYLERNAKGMNGKTLRQIKDNLGRQEVFKQHGKSKGAKIEESISILCSNGIVEKRQNGTRETFVYRG